MRTLTAAAIAASVMAFSGTGIFFLALQDVAPAPATTQTQPQQPQAGADEAARNKEVDRLIAAFGHILTAAQSLTGLTETDLMAVERLRADLEMYNLRWPEDQRMIALELQCSRWLSDRDRVDRLFGQLVDLNPETPAMVITWAEDLYGRNEYSRVLEVLDLSQQKEEDVPALAFLRAKALFALNRFEECKAALGIIPENPQLKANHLLELARMRNNINNYIELWKSEQAKREAEESAGDLPIVKLETERGDIILALYENEAPETVANFITLVESGFYDGTNFHRVVNNHVTQGGDPNTKAGATGVIGEGGPGYTIKDEFQNPGYRAHFAGSLGMAHGSPPNSGGSQFYIMHEPKPDLNGKYTVFGRVLEGLDIARQMKQKDTLIKATVVRKRDHEYTFSKIQAQGPGVEPANATAAPVTKSADPRNTIVDRNPALDDKPAEEPAQPE